MKRYTVQYELNGHRDTQSLDATTPGQAFSKVLKLFPGAKLIEATWSGHMAGHVSFPVVRIRYGAPSARGVEPLPSDPKREQASFGFLDKIKPRPRR